MAEAGDDWVGVSVDRGKHQGVVKGCEVRRWSAAAHEQGDVGSRVESETIKGVHDVHHCSWAGDGGPVFDDGDGRVEVSVHVSDGVVPA